MSGMGDSGSSSTSSTCHCGKFCFCGLRVYAGEGEESFRSNTIISWQHFPPSTSSRSRCDDSSMEPTKDHSLPESTCRMESVREESTPSVISSTEYPISKSLAQLNAEHYLKIRHVYEFFNFLIGHLVCAEPEEPVQYLTEILDRCLRFRDCGEEEPLLVSKYHIKSLYDVFDAYGSGFITPGQYQLAMDNIGISKGLTPNNPNPPVNGDGKVSEEFFVNEAHRCLKENLRMMLRIPKDWEENRQIWQRVMLRRQGRDIRSSSCVKDEQLGEFTSEAESVCDRGEAVKEVVCRGTCPRKMKHEPEQLFLSSSKQSNLN